MRIDCRQCDTGLASPYQVVLPRPPQGRTFYLELLHRDGTSERYGPAVRSAPARAAVAPGKESGGKGRGTSGTKTSKP